MKNLANGEYGEKIWEKKINVQDEVGVIHGSNSSMKRVVKQTQDFMKVFDREVRLKKGAKILDAGTGPMARFSIEFAKRGYKVTGLDISKTTLDYAKKYISKEKVSVNLLKGDMTQLNKDSGKFDIIFCIETFFHIPPHLTGITLMKFNNLLNDKGICLIQFGIKRKKTLKERIISPLYWTAHYVKRFFGKGFNVNVSRFTRREIEEMVNRSGFKIKKEINEGVFIIQKVN